MIGGWNKENPRHKKRVGIYQVYPRSWKEIKQGRKELLELFLVIVGLWTLDKIIRVLAFVVIHYLLN